MEPDHNVNFIKRSSKLQMDDDEVQFQNGGSLLGISTKIPTKWPKSKVLLIASLIALFVVTMAMLLLLFDRRHYSTGWRVKPGSDAATHAVSTVRPETSANPLVAQTTTQWESFRLPTKLKPSHYRLSLTTFIEEDFFSGRVDITFQCLEATNVVILHQEDLDMFVNSIHLTRKDQKETIQLQSPPNYHKSYSFYIMHFQNDLQAGETYVLHLEFQGNFAPSMYGIYRSQYQTKSGPRYVIASFLSPMGARRVFPCFDEPAFKANFSVTITHPSHYTALSNMPEESKRVVNTSWIETKFQDTPLMSTYLLSFAVTKFSAKAKVLPNNVELRVWCREEVINDTELAFSEAEKQFLFLEEYSGFRYPLPKLDLIGLPELIPAGMENWGLITLKEKHLAINTQTISTLDLHASLFVIAHELSHQWYSNLVTQSFWDELWLKECFASLLGYLALDNVHPEWKTLEDQAFTQNMLSIMKLDAMPTSHPILREINEPSQVLDNFDRIIYWKSTAVVRMLLDLIGETAFKTGMARFLNERAYQNANSEDIWNALDKNVDHNDLGIHIADLMRPWLLQSGYPIVRVTTNPGRGKVKVEQNIFLLNEEMKENLPPSPYNYRWDIPLTFVTGSQNDRASPQQYVIKRSAETATEINIENYNENDWIIVNANRTGYYRVWYDEQNRNRLLRQLDADHEAISPASRAALIDDAFILSMAGYLSYSDLFRFTKYMSKERHHLPWGVLLDNFAYVTQMLSLTSAYGLIQDYMLQLIGPVYDAALDNLNNKVPDSQRLLQASIFQAACQYGYPPCIEKAKLEFKRYVDDGVSLHPNFKDSILSAAMVDSDGTTHAFNCLKESDSCGGNSFQWLVALSAAPEPWIISRYADGLFQMDEIITKVTTWFNTEYQLAELEQFTASKQGDLEGAAGLSSLKAAIDNTKSNVRWMNDNYGNVKTWLEQNREIVDQSLRS